MDLEHHYSSASINLEHQLVGHAVAELRNEVGGALGKLVSDETSSGSGSSSGSSSPLGSPRHSPSLSIVSSPSPRKAGLYDSDEIDMCSLQVVEISGSNKPTAVERFTPASKKLIKADIELPLRPDFGTEGRPISLKANVFPLTFPKNTKIYHYDIEIVSDRLKKDEKRDFFRDFCKQNKHLFKETGRYGFAYDGEKNVYTIEKIVMTKRLMGKGPFPAIKAECQWKGDKVPVVLQEVGELNTECLQQFLDRKGPNFSDMSPECIDVVNALNIVLRHEPSNKYVSVRGVAGHSFFPDPRVDCVSLGAGLELWPGYHQSIRHSQIWKPLLNFDVANTAFFKEQSVIDYMREVCRLRQLREPRDVSKQDLMKFEKSLKGLKIEPTHRQGVVRRYKVMGITRTTASSTFFEGENGRISVEQYFQEKYNIRLRYPWLPVAKCGGKGAMLPFEVLKIAPRQRYQKKLGDQQLATLIRSAAKPADERQREIEQWVKHANINNDPVAKQFGIHMEHKMVQLQGRVLKAPELEYRDKMTVRPQKGAWDMGRGGFRFKKSIDLQYWAIVSLDDRTDHKMIKNFVGFLQDQAERAGFDIDNPKKAYSANRPKELSRILNDMIHKIPELQLVLIIVPRKDSATYSEVKRIGDTEVGVMTQVLCQQTMQKAMKSPSTMLNLLMKINTKVGGQNVSIPSKMRSPIMNEPVIVLGADVTHPAAGEFSRPSIAAIVGSMDPVPSKYIATVSVQERRLEFIADTKDMVKKLLKKFYSKNKQKPQRIIMYRDGVGEGQFKLVLAHEMEAIRAACNELEKDGGYTPGITFVCVQKRHHMRLFCEDRQDMVGKSNNIPAGTCVDTNICHPSQYDFYLCSHAGIQGTSRPTHYHVLHDDNDYHSDVLQNFSYQLCHTYVRCTRAVSIPAPTYYAHLVAYRARYHMQAVMDNDSDNGSFAGSYRGGAMATQLDLNKLDKMINVHSDVACMMYFA